MAISKAHRLGRCAKCGEFKKNCKCSKRNDPTTPKKKIPKRFKLAKENKWEQPVMDNYLMKCCDCGLIHDVDFRIAYGKEEKDNRVQLRMRRITQPNNPKTTLLTNT